LRLAIGGRLLIFGSVRDAPEFLTHNPMLWLALGTVFFLGFVAGVIWGRGRLQKWLARTVADKSKSIASIQLRRLGLQQFVVFVRGTLHAASVVLLVAASALWIVFVLSRFDTTKPFAEALLKNIGEQGRELGHDLLGALPGLLAVVIVFVIARFAHRLINQFFETITKSGLTTETFDPATAETTRRIAQVLLWVSAVIIAYPYIPGSSSPAFRGVSVLAGLMFSLGSTNLVSQLTNGLILTYTRSIRADDVIKTGEHEGTVVRLGFFTTTIRTAREELISLPNSQLASGVVNYSTPREGRSVRFSVGVGIGYDTSWQQVHELLLAAAAKVENVARDPAPEIRQTALNDFAVQYELLFSLDDPSKRVAASSELNRQIQEAFHTAGVQIMSPHYIADPAQPKLPPSSA
jgi:small-conductance mechanosensitive channel